jgi:hypothetical protein
MKKMSALALAGLLAGVAAPASAQMREQGVYEMVTTHQYENASFGASTAHHRRSPGHWNATSRVIILDKRNGALWAWSEPEQTVMYLGQIFPLTGSGVFARIIQVEPDQKAR